MSKVRTSRYNNELAQMRCDFCAQCPEQSCEGCHVLEFSKSIYDRVIIVKENRK